MTSETCSISSKDVERFRSYGVPDGAKVEKPSSNQTIFDRPKGMVAVYLEFFESCGLRFPLTAFFQECLLYYGVSITQLTPNSVRCMVGFEILCRLANVKPSMALFGYFFIPVRIFPHWYSIRPKSTPNPKLLLNLRQKSVWKSKFVFIGEEMFPEKMVWKRTYNEHPDPWLTGKVLDEVRILSVFGVDWSVLLTEKILHSAKMPNVYSGPLPEKFCDKNGNEVSAVDFLRGMSPVKSGGGNDGKLRKTPGGYATPSKRAKLSDDDDVQILTTTFAKNPPQESITITPSNKFAAGTSAKLSSSHRSTKDKHIAALEEVKFGYKDAGSELVTAQNLAENYQQELNAEVKKNRVLQEALDKSKRELEAKYWQGSEKITALEEALAKAKREVEASQTEASNCEQGWNAEVKKNRVLQEALDKANRELEAKHWQGLEKITAPEEALEKTKREVEESQAKASNYEQEWNAEVKKNVALDKAKRELEAKCRQGLEKNSALEKAKREMEASNYEQEWNAEVKKNVALKEDLENARRELGETHNEASYYGDMYREKLGAVMQLQKFLETAKKELDAEKKRSVVAREEADEARKSAAAAEQEVSDLRSRIRGFYMQCCPKD